jgi:hypothetical protein
VTGTGDNILPGDDIGKFQFHFAMFLVQQTGKNLSLGVESAIHGRDDYLAEFSVEKKAESQQYRSNSGNLPDE